MNQPDHRKVLHLMEKGKKGLVGIIFSRLGLIVALLLIQLAMLFGLFRWFSAFVPHYFGGTLLFNLGMVVYLLNTPIDPTAKLTWLIVILLLPVFGALLYLYTQSDLGHRALRHRVYTLKEETRDDLPSSPERVARLKLLWPGEAAMTQYVRHSGCYPVWENTRADYLPSGEKKLDSLLVDLENAHHFIFLEYFIIEEGIMWGQVLDILARKAKEGVDVRVLMDGTCEFTKLSHDYPARMRKLGIQCKLFAPVTPFVSTHYNYRDHRKITVIDGQIGYTGGINLADEYINQKHPYGRWKDAAIRLQGEAVRSFTLMFLEMWAMDERATESARFLAYPIRPVLAPGFVMPFGDCPLDGAQVGERVYMDILNRAQRYVHIMTPYLILDGVMETALCYAAERGVDVHLILPGIPDKKYAWALAHTHYPALLKAGVKISEYSPGFVHAKVFVSDDHEGVVGTINLDYRSLYHHFECATYLLETPCLADMERDFQLTLRQCRTMTPALLREDPWQLKLCGALLKTIAPLM